MAMPRRGTRTIVVDGVRYRWTVTDRRDHQHGIVVELADAPAGLMTASAVPGAVVLPGMVAAAIRDARDRGWQPSLPGPPFRLRALLVGEPTAT